MEWSRITIVMNTNFGTELKKFKVERLITGFGKTYLHKSQEIIEKEAETSKECWL